LSLDDSKTYFFIILLLFYIKNFPIFGILLIYIKILKLNAKIDLFSSTGASINSKI